MSDNLDRIEKLVESNAKAILALTNQGVELNAKIDSTNASINRTNASIDRTNAIVVELANVVYAMASRQEDNWAKDPSSQEHRIGRLEYRL